MGRKPAGRAEVQSRQSEEQVPWPCRGKELGGFKDCQEYHVVVGSNDGRGGGCRGTQIAKYLIDHSREFAFYFKCNENAFKAFIGKVM